MKAKQLRPIPGAVRKGRWQVRPLNPAKGDQPVTSVRGRIMQVPLDADETTRQVQLHEMGHAAWSPAESARSRAGKLGVPEPIMQGAEDARITRKLAALDLPQDRPLIPDDDRARGQLARLAQRSPAAAVGMIAAAVGTGDAALLADVVGGAYPGLPERVSGTVAHALNGADLDDPTTADRLAAALAPLVPPALRGGGSFVQPDGTARASAYRAAGAAGGLRAAVTGKVSPAPPTKATPPPPAAGPAHRPTTAASGPARTTDAASPPPDYGRTMATAKGAAEVDANVADTLERVRNHLASVARRGNPEPMPGDILERYSHGAPMDGPLVAANGARFGRITDYRRPPLTYRQGKFRMRKARRTCTDTGAIPRAMHRLTIDGRPFRGPRAIDGKPGTVLIDLSGSMGLSAGDIAAILRVLPASTVAGYSGKGGQGILTVLARRGMSVDPAMLPAIRSSHPGGNCIDGPALEWLAEQAAPRIWISDGAVTADGTTNGSSHGDAPVHPVEIVKLARTLRRGKIRRYRTAAEAVEALRA